MGLSHPLGLNGLRILIPEAENVWKFRLFLERYKTLKKRSLKIEGAKIFNSIPEEIRLFAGKLDHFKTKLDNYLEKLPDQPQTESLTPEAMTIYRIPSNSIIDWARKLS